MDDLSWLTHNKAAIQLSLVLMATNFLFGYIKLDHHHKAERYTVEMMGQVFEPGKYSDQ
jgi:hypothetical protein